MSRYLSELLNLEITAVTGKCCVSQCWHPDRAGHSHCTQRALAFGVVLQWDAWSSASLCATKFPCGLQELLKRDEPELNLALAFLGKRLKDSVYHLVWILTSLCSSAYADGTSLETTDVGNGLWMNGLDVVSAVMMGCRQSQLGFGVVFDLF